VEKGETVVVVESDEQIWMWSPSTRAILPQSGFPSGEKLLPVGAAIALVAETEAK